MDFESPLINNMNFYKGSKIEKNSSDEETQQTKVENNKLNPINKIREDIKGSNILENFEILNHCKSGSVGIVLNGRFKKIKNTILVALKFLIKQKNEEQDNVEISIHEKLKHKNIPNIYQYYKIKNGSCIVMEYIKYGDLSNFKKVYLKRKYLSESFICFVSYKILEAILYLHKNKIIHLDIKPQNVLIDDFLNVKLTDFSISYNYKSSKKYITLPKAGTCYYICPEVLNEKKIKVSDASKIDIYSLGVLLYVLAFNDYPYELINVKNTDYEEIAKNIKEKNLQFPENTGHSNMFKNFVEKCLDKDIKNRYNIYEALNDPWIRAYKILLDEKERILNGSKFLINMMTDNIFEFNEFVQKKEK